MNEKTCHWERCAEPAPNRARWRREAADGHRDVHDYANYCDGHMMMATAQGAVCIKRDDVKEPVSSIPPTPWPGSNPNKANPPAPPLWKRALQARGQK
jgi:hypothetical protein